MLPHQGKVALYSFLSALASLVFISPPLTPQYDDNQEYNLGCLLPLLFCYYSLLFAVIRLFLADYSVQVAWRAYMLGIIFSIGIYVSVLSRPTLSIFGWYMCLMSFFHFSEFVSIAATNPNSLSIDSFILDHSTEYKVAAVASWVEFFVELYFFPDLKNHRGVSLFGLVVCIGGEAVRKLAMWTAKSNFNHIVQDVHHEGHVLITNGIYSLCRHPSYAGWFYWAIATQVVLVNPICVVAYVLASWKFFHDRILIEEVTLLNFFQNDYVKYQSRVSTGLPFIRGYLIDD